MIRNYSKNSPQDDKEGIGLGEGHEDGEDGGDARRNDRDDQSAEENMIIFQSISNRRPCQISTGNNQYGKA